LRCVPCTYYVTLLRCCSRSFHCWLFERLFCRWFQKILLPHVLFHRLRLVRLLWLRLRYVGFVLRLPTRLRRVCVICRLRLRFCVTLCVVAFCVCSFLRLLRSRRAFHYWFLFTVYVVRFPFRYATLIFTLPHVWLRCVRVAHTFPFGFTFHVLFSLHERLLATRSRLVAFVSFGFVCVAFVCVLVCCVCCYVFVVTFTLLRSVRLFVVRLPFPFALISRCSAYVPRCFLRFVCLFVARFRLPSRWVPFTVAAYVRLVGCSVHVAFTFTRLDPIRLRYLVCLVTCYRLVCKFRVAFTTFTVVAHIHTCFTSHARLHDSVALVITAFGNTFRFTVHPTVWLPHDTFTRSFGYGWFSSRTRFRCSFLHVPVLVTLVAGWFVATTFVRCTVIHALRLRLWFIDARLPRVWIPYVAARLLLWFGYFNVWFGLRLHAARTIARFVMQPSCHTAFVRSVTFAVAVIAVTHVYYHLPFP